ncbi:uncharacterized protein N0V89_010680 [Didymosphaeria variabile]|uniref:F-box domain-containing protein n=1 Tax=Didymosphaeria variabile TaxID=1932322 RepID=A0A9W9C6T5_9PLEO|nr:uncharacterized protein N0V89_010680 [Didymosphaeria variabile]KAJ4346748.1 hypothetical protein N0V89_010680 [Didymosphaeria variabile]
MLWSCRILLYLLLPTKRDVSSFVTTSKPSITTMPNAAPPLALTTPELLEYILAFLPPRDLLLVQRVCKPWHDLITTSPTLQTLLYFRAPPPSSSPSLTPFSSSEYTLNPLLKSAFPFLFSPNKVQSAERAEDWDVEWGDLELPAAVDPNVKPFIYSSFNRNPAAFRRKEASWRRMHISNPPVRTIVWRRESAGMAGLFIGECVTGFGDSTGRTSSITLGTLGEDALQRKWDEESRSGFRKTDEGYLISKDQLDLQKEDGLRMAVLYDYLFEVNCTGYVPSHWNVEFAVGQYPHPQKVVEYAHQPNAELSLAKLMRDEEHEEHEGAGVTMLVEVHWSKGCIVEEEEDYQQFRSDGYQNVDVGPMARLKEMMWD